MKRRIMVDVILCSYLVFCISYLIIMNNLIVDEKPNTSDVIIVAEGQDVARAYRASELLNKGFSKTGLIIVSPINKTNAPDYRILGINQAQIIPETKATSTYENAVITLKMMKEHEFNSAIIISSDYHMLRIKLIYERINHEYGYDLTYVAAAHFVEDELVPWYEAGPNVKRVANREFWKFLGYMFGMYHFFNL